MNVTLFEKETIHISDFAIESLKHINVQGKNQILLASRDYKAYIVDLSDDPVNNPSRVIKAFPGHKKRATGVEYSPTGDIIITVGADQKLIFWERESMKIIGSFPRHTRAITSVAINSQHDKIVTTSDDCSFIVSNTQGEVLMEFNKEIENFHRENITKCGFIPNTLDQLATASVDGTVKIWDLNDKSMLKTFINGNYIDYEKSTDMKKGSNISDYDIDSAVTAISFSKDGSLLTYGGRNGKVYVTSLATNENLQKVDFPDKITAIASGENQPLIAVAIPNKILIWHILETKFVGQYEFATFGEHYCNSLTFIGEDLYAGLFNGDLLRLSLSRS